MKRATDSYRGLSASVRVLLATAGKHALALVIPFASLALFIVWFCTIPSYRARPLPATWTPGCPELAQWQTASSIHSEDRVLTPLSGMPASMQDLYVAERDAKHGHLHRLDRVTGELKQSSAAYPAVKELRWIDEEILLTGAMMPGEMPALVFLDAETLTPIREMQLQSGQLTLTKYQSPYLELLYPMSPEGYVGVFWVTDERTHTYWFRANLTGEIQELKLLDTRGSIFELGPGDPPATFLTIDAGSAMTLKTYDLKTGEASWSTPSQSDVSLPNPPSRRGWTPVAPTSIMATEASLIPQLSHPSLFGRHVPIWLPSPKDGWDFASYEFARFRHSVLEALYGQESLEQAADRVYQLSGLTVVDPLNPVSVHPVRGDLLRTEQAQAALDLKRSEHDLPHSQTPTRLELGLFNPAELSCRIDPLNGQAYLVTQTLTEFPDAVSIAPSIFRVGVLRMDATEVEWLAWCPLSEPPDRANPVQAMAHGDHILIYRTRWVERRSEKRVEAKSGIQWITIPLPVDLIGWAESATP